MALVAARHAGIHRTFEKFSKYFCHWTQIKSKSIAVIGPRANEVLLDWYSGQPPYAVTPLEGIKNKVGNNVTVNFAANNKEVRRETRQIIRCGDCLRR